MNSEYRQQLLNVLAKLDQDVAYADWILTQPRDAEMNAMADELRELLIEMQAKVEANLERSQSVIPPHS